jgi:hypothetical protein
MLKLLSLLSTSALTAYGHPHAGVATGAAPAAVAASVLGTFTPVARSATPLTVRAKFLR